MALPGTRRRRWPGPSLQKPQCIYGITWASKGHLGIRKDEEGQGQAQGQGRSRGVDEGWHESSGSHQTEGQDSGVLLVSWAVMFTEGHQEFCGQFPGSSPETELSLQEEHWGIVSGSAPEAG